MTDQQQSFVQIWLSEIAEKYADSAIAKTIIESTSGDSLDEEKLLKNLERIAILRSEEDSDDND